MAVRSMGPLRRLARPLAVRSGDLRTSLRGGVTVSYFEWVQNLMNYYWTEKEVFEKLRPIMITAFDDVWNASQKYQCDLRTGAYIVATARVAEAMKALGRV
jgi:glutamate dehydrogenase